MHNGVIENYRDLAVDSFNLSFMPDDADELLQELKATGETFANIFLIMPDIQVFGVVRLSTGSLYSDGKGNYSTNPMGPIDKPVPAYSAATHGIDGYEFQSRYKALNETHGMEIESRLDLEYFDEKYEAEIERLGGWDSSSWESIPPKKRLG